MHIFKLTLILSLLIFQTSWVPQSNSSLLNVDQPPFIDAMYNEWVDSTMHAMSLEEKIGQLFMVAAYSNKDIAHIEEIESLINNQHIGGLIFFQGGPERQIDLTNRYQGLAKVPLLIAGDWEWGLSMRLDSTIRFPRQMMLGAINNDSLLFAYGKEVAKEIKLMGAHINFAPVVDINNNAANPVIGSRSFGENRENVSNKATLYAQAMQSEGVLAVAKHFPGHGDTDVDSHKDLPIINHTYQRLDSIELYPFKKMFSAGVGGVMVAHLFVPALDSTANTATTLSPKVSTGLLRDSLKFLGLSFTDALNMKGVSNFYEPGEADLRALLAGNDVLLYPKDVPKSIEMIKVAIEDGTLSLKTLEWHVRKILAVKYWTGAYERKYISKKDVYQQLNSDKVQNLNQRLIEEAITLISQKNRALPLRGLENLRIASVAIGETEDNEFQKTLSLFSEVEHFNINKFASDEEWNNLEKQLSSFNLVIFSFNKTNRIPNKNYGISLISMKKVEEYAKNHSVIVDIFANPYTIRNFEDIEVFKALIVSYNDWDITQKMSAQLIFGSIPAKGTLPVSVAAMYPAGSGSFFDAIPRLKYTTPIDAGIDANKLYKIDSIIINSIREEAFPGCQVLAARNGKVFYHKAFGHYTYDKKQAVNTSDLYDLASVTKVFATTASVMKLCDRHQINVDETLSKYLLFLDSTNKADLKIKDVMRHQASLKPWIPFYLKTIKDEKLKLQLYRTEAIDKWQYQVAENLFIDTTYKDSMLLKIALSDLRDKNDYKYSDLGFYLLKEIIEESTHESLDRFTMETFYKPIGASSMVFNPLNYFTKDQIVPTENDDYFRNQLIQGYVHDMGAAMLGGVSGHAGLFSNANDAAKMMQMFLNGGYYGDRQYISDSTLKAFTSCMDCSENRRGIGFDKAEMIPSMLGPTCSESSSKSFGHTGFTGTMVWADPSNGLVYIFLSNRIYPKSDNDKLVKLHTRTKIQEVLYQSVL
ncbi:MAG: serine hydrolase [Bacteroidales bacterium]|nr:serine hydrolase [Bacteroidales bacterium]